jgi:hypothetical protein
MLRGLTIVSGLAIASMLGLAEGREPRDRARGDDWLLSTTRNAGATRRYLPRSCLWNTGGC